MFPMIERCRYGDLWVEFRKRRDGMLRNPLGGEPEMLYPTARTFAAAERVLRGLEVAGCPVPCLDFGSNGTVEFWLTYGGVVVELEFGMRGEGVLEVTAWRNVQDDLGGSPPESWRALGGLLADGWSSSCLSYADALRGVLGSLDLGDWEKFRLLQLLQLMWVGCLDCLPVVEWKGNVLVGDVVL